MRNFLGAMRLIAGPFVTFCATLVGAAFFVSALLYFSPGNAADVVANDEALRLALVKDWGLDQSLFHQTFTFLRKAIQGDFGVSLTYRQGMQVSEILKAKAPVTLLLVSVALFSSIAVGTTLAFITEGKTFSISRRLLQAVSVLPVFLIAYLSMVGLDSYAYETTVALDQAPPSWFPLLIETSALKTALAVATLAVGSSALTETHTALESEIRVIRQSGYVDAARARGDATWPHTLSNLLPVLANQAATRTAFLLGGVIIVEKVYGIRGLGDVLWSACRYRDYPLVLGITLLSAAFVCSARLIGDWVRLALDPRLRVRQ